MNQNDLAERCRNIRVVITDVDGVLTDGGMYYSENGDELKKFNVRDGVGVAMLKEAGIKVGAMTGESTQLTIRRLKKMGTDFAFYGVVDKCLCLKGFLTGQGVAKEEVAYIGDEINDYCLLGEVGLFFAVADGNPELRRHASVTLCSKGGAGALREVAWFLLDSQGLTKDSLSAYQKGRAGKARSGPNGAFVDFSVS